MPKLTPTTVPERADTDAVARTKRQEEYLADCPSRKVIGSRIVEFAWRTLPSGRTAPPKPPHQVLSLECGHEVTHVGVFATKVARCPACGPAAFKKR